MNADQISYALAKQVPDMRGRAFTIETSYGEIVVQPGPLADALADQVRKHLETELELHLVGQEEWANQVREQPETEPMWAPGQA